MCFDSSSSAFALDFRNEAVLTMTGKHWVATGLLFECSAKARFALQIDSEPANVGVSVCKVYDGSLCYLVVWYATQIIT